MALSRYKEFCESKLNGLKLFEDQFFHKSWIFNRKKSLLDETVIQRAKAGVYLWCASHVLHSPENMELTMELYGTAKSYVSLHNQLHEFIDQYKPHRKRTRCCNGWRFSMKKAYIGNRKRKKKRVFSYFWLSIESKRVYLPHIERAEDFYSIEFNELCGDCCSRQGW